MLIDGGHGVIPHGGREWCAGCGGRELGVCCVHEVSDVGNSERDQDTYPQQYSSSDYRDNPTCMTQERERERSLNVLRLNKFRTVYIVRVGRKIKRTYYILFRVKSKDFLSSFSYFRLNFRETVIRYAYLFYSPLFIMANIDHAPSRTMLNLLHILPPFADEAQTRANTIIEINSHSINKYEIITESGQLKLDRVGYSSLAYPFSYGAIPCTWDEDNDPLDIMIVNVTEPLVPGSLVEARIIGIMKFVDGGEVDDKVIAVLADDKRVDHIRTIADLGEYFTKETKYYWEHYKDLKKPGTGEVKGFFDAAEAVRIIEECRDRYDREYRAKVA